MIYKQIIIRIKPTLSCVMNKINLTAKAMRFYWRGLRDLNSRAGFPTYSLSRGAPSPLG